MGISHMDSRVHFEKEKKIKLEEKKKKDLPHDKILLRFLTLAPFFNQKPKQLRTFLGGIRCHQYSDP